MFPNRRFSSFLSRIFLVLILLSTPILIISSLRKYLFQKPDIASLSIREHILQKYEVNHGHSHSKSYDKNHRVI